MSKSVVSLSFAVPLELSIQMNVYMETKGLNRSQLIKAALRLFLEIQKKKEDIPVKLEEIHQELLNIKKIVSKKA
ncbi:MAG: hypothetical protein COA94_09260 [Rickettsiales bacterium]|nr:MAG: hypothetical protein COA94_09260 [Rickettsiales bacterium]